MLFNSIEFLFLFLPLAVIGYWWIQHFNSRLATAWLVASSLFFYSWWNISYLPLILGSAGVNFLIGRGLNKNYQQGKPGKGLISAGILFNITLLGYYKYTDFMIDNLNQLLSRDMPLTEIVLPLAISFFTFQQISFLVDSYRGKAKERDFLTYLLFVTFFPQLIAGPIVHHKEMMPQFHSRQNRRLNYDNLSRGLFIFAIGLFKKIIIADEFALTANAGFAAADQLSLLEAWATSLSYTLQLYFDFSAYCDMAIGVALFFNIKLPVNFNSPYKSLDIQEFWRRWHITLSAFLRDYVYIPLGGNRYGFSRTLTNLFITFLIGGIWHGAGWTFIVWGAMHGAALAVHRIWQKTGVRLNRLLAWFITFNFINIAWVFFRAEQLSDATHIARSMLGLNGIIVPEALADKLPQLATLGEVMKRFPTLHDFSGSEFYTLVVFILICLFHRNSIEMKDRLQYSPLRAGFTVVVFIWAVSNINRVSEFIYFNF